MAGRGNSAVDALFSMLGEAIMARWIATTETFADETFLNDSQPRLIHLAGKIVYCDSAEDLILLKEAKILEKHPASVLNFTVGRLQLIREACQRYSLGKHQRLMTLAIERAGR
jgi:hypothetical protein